MILKGWIAADYSDKELIEESGAKLGNYDYDMSEFIDCEVSIEALGKLDQYWGRIYWGLE